MIRLISLVILCGSLAGCGVLVDLNKLLCLGGDLPTTLTEIPPDLRYVVEHRDDFDTGEHPLADTVAGTVMDDIGESLDGCWGYIGVETLSPLEPDELVAAAVYRIDLASGLVQLQEYTGLDGSLSMWDDLPAVFVRDRQIIARSDSILEVEPLFSDGALIESDGTLRGDCLTAVAATISTAAPIELTIAGDAMVTMEDYPSGAVARQWFRFDCQTEDIELLPDSEPTAE